MNDSYIKNYPRRSLAWFLSAFIILLIALVGWRYITKPSPAKKDEIIAKSLDEGANIFHNWQRKLLQRTESLAAELRFEESQDSTLRWYEILEEETELWGSMLVKEGEPIVWQGFSLGVLKSAYPDTVTDSYIEIKRENNVLFWLAHASFTRQAGQDSVTYHLFAAERLMQNNALKIGNEREYHFLDEAARRYNYPLSFSILEPPPDEEVLYRVLHNPAQDSIGIVYAVPGHFQQLLNDWQEANSLWYSLFAVFFFVSFLMFITFYIELKSIWSNLIIRIIFILVGWLFFYGVSISTRWLQEMLSAAPPELFASYQSLAFFAINAVFLFLIAYSIHRTLRDSVTQYRECERTASVTGGFIAGVFVMLLISVAGWRAFRLVHGTSFPLLDLQIIPPAGVILLYLSLGLMLWAVALLVLNINRFIFRICRNHYKWALFTSVAGFIVAFIIFNFLRKEHLLSWQFYAGLAFYGLICTLSFIYFRFPAVVRNSSTLRRVAVVAFIIAAAGTVLIYYGQLKTQDGRLAEVAREYSKQEDLTARSLTQKMLNELHSEFSSFSRDSLQANETAVKSIFTETINEHIAGQRPVYRFDFRLITEDRDLIAAYSNALDTPEWVNSFTPDRYYAASLIQGLSRNNVMPVIQKPVLINREDYETLYRGWIPFFASQERPFAWIVGSVYQKRIDYKKPMQAVMVAGSYKSWNNTIMVQRYESGRLASTIYKGAVTHFPIFNQLPAEAANVNGDPHYYYNSDNAEHSYRNLIVSKPYETVLKISAASPDLHNILFTFFRLHLTLILAGVGISFLLQLLKSGRIVLVNRNTQFRYRILDSFLLATLGFLMLMIAVTYYALNRQSESLVKQQLFDDLEAVAFNENGNTAFAGSSIFSVFETTAEQLNTDAAFYIDKAVFTSTTPQIYRQHLLSGALPFPVYVQLYKNQKRSTIQRVDLSGEPLFVGYRLLLDENREPLAAIAIPAFAESPVYRSRLLETGSFLVLLYALIFFIFIISAIFISHRLTRPLYEIRRGLYQISKGNLDTAIPVKSKDEIGILAASYNRMASRLKKLQDELAKSEREAAWKEIAREAAHEIKNPLTPMKLNVQHLRQQADSNNSNNEKLKEKIRQVTQNMLVQIDSLNTIAYNFLSYSTSDSGDFKPVDMHKLIEQLTGLHENIDHTKIEVNLTKSPAVVPGVEDDLHSVVFNLIKNAYEASDKGGVINVSTATDGGSFFMIVQNDGDVIPEEIRDEIFNPNISTKSSGTGLGLAISKKVVALHNGKITFSSNKEEGTTFTVQLPLAPVKEEV